MPLFCRPLIKLTLKQMRIRSPTLVVASAQCLENSGKFITRNSTMSFLLAPYVMYLLWNREENLLKLLRQELLSIIYKILDSYKLYYRFKLCHYFQDDKCRRGQIGEIEKTGPRCGLTGICIFCICRILQYQKNRVTSHKFICMRLTQNTRTSFKENECFSCFLFNLVRNVGTPEMNVAFEFSAFSLPTLYAACKGTRRHLDVKMYMLWNISRLCR